MCRKKHSRTIVLIHFFLLRQNLDPRKATEIKRQYRLKYNLLRERCDAISQDNEQLVSRIWQVSTQVALHMMVNEMLLLVPIIRYHNVLSFLLPRYNSFAKKE